MLELRGIDNNANNNSIRNDDNYVLAEGDVIPTFSADSRGIFNQSTREGIEVFGPPRKADTFVEWNTIWSGKVVNQFYFKRTVIALILLDSILLGIETFDFATDNRGARAAFDALNLAFLSFFTIEMLLQLLFRRLSFFRDGWLVLDLIVVATSWFLAFFLILRAFRVIRAMRLATRVSQLRNVALTIMRVVPNVVAVLTLFLLLFYVSCVMFTSLFKDLYENGSTSEDYFSRLDVTALTLFRIMTLDEWWQIAKEVIAVHTWAWFPFVAFISISTFFLLNMTIAMVCEAVLFVQNNGKEGELSAADKPSDPMAAVSADIAKLEYKIEMLASTVDTVLNQQLLLQQSMVNLKLEHPVSPENARDHEQHEATSDNLASAETPRAGRKVDQ